MKTVWSLLLALGSLAVGLALCEGALRVFHPRYEYAAGPPQRTYHWSLKYRHPDTGAQHLVVYNNLGSRQHRDFSDRDLIEGVNLAFFGDSFTENLRLPAHHSFTEVLDYLLNARPRPLPGAKRPASSAPAPSRFNVLNFGIEGTGPVEQYLAYRNLARKLRSTHVFYVHMENDVANVQTSLARGGAPELLARQAGKESHAWIRALSGLHLTYLALDAWHRLDLSPRLVVTPESDAVAAFEAILRRWRSDVKARGGEFHIVLLPTPDGDKWFRRLASQSSWDVVDLPRCFNEAIPNFDYNDWRFAKDSHWNEAGNMMAAHCLYRHLEGRLDMPERSDAELARLRHAYYHAFGDRSRFGDAAGWMPSPPWASPAPLADGEAARIVARYQALGEDGSIDRQRIVNAVRTSEPVLRSVWDVHVSAEHRLVVYVKAPCDEPDPAANLFLHLRPVNILRLGQDERRQGFRVADHLFLRSHVRRTPSPSGGECVLAVSLREWPIASARTGQYAAGNTLWEGEFPVDSEDWNRVRRQWRDIAESDPAARSVWNVYARRKRREVAFLKAPCTWNDTVGSFFVNAPPARKAQGRVHVETAFAAPPPGQFATLFDDRCLIAVSLPEWPVGPVWVGERNPDTRVLRWQAKLH